MMIFDTLLQMNIQASILIVVVLIVRIFLKKMPRIYSYLLWALVLIRLLCPIFIESNYSLQPNLYVENVSQSETMIPIQNGESTQIFPTIDGNNVPVMMPEEHMMPEEIIMPHKISKKVDYMQIFKILWKIGTLGIIIYLLVSYIFMKQRLRFAVRMEAVEKVWRCEQIDTPFVFGVLFPAIYIPYDLEDESLHYIIQHEKTHIKHKDPLVRMIVFFALAIYWWNPLIWLFAKNVVEDMEMICDEAVLKNADIAEKQAYSRTLLDFSMKKSGLSVVILFGESNTKKRVEHVLTFRKPVILVSVGILVIIIVCAIGFLTVPKSKKDQAISNNQEENIEKTLEGQILGGSVVTWTVEELQTEKTIDLDLDGTSERIWCEYEDMSTFDLYNIMVNDTVLRRYESRYESIKDIKLIAFAISENAMCLAIPDNVSNSVSLFIFEEGYLYHAGNYALDMKTAVAVAGKPIGTYRTTTSLPFTREVEFSFVRDPHTHSILIKDNAQYIDRLFDIQLKQPLYVHLNNNYQSTGFYLDPQYVSLVETDAKGWVYLQGQYYTAGWVNYSSFGGFVDEENQNLSLALTFRVLKDNLKDSKDIFYKDYTEFTEYTGNLADLKNNVYAMNVDLDNDNKEESILRFVDGEFAYYTIELTRGGIIELPKRPKNYCPFFRRIQFAEGNFGVLCRFYVLADPNGGLVESLAYVKKENSNSYENIEFNYYTQPPLEEKSDFGENIFDEYNYAMDYTGYLDDPDVRNNTFLARKNGDYDKDGIKDRIYRKVQGQDVIYRIEFTNSDTLELPKFEKGLGIGIQSVDVTMDGVAELLVTQSYTLSTRPSLENVLLYQRVGRQYVPMEIPSFERDGYEYVGYEMYYEIIDEHNCRIYNDAYNFSCEVKREEWMNEKQGMCQISCGPTVQIAEYNGKTALLFLESIAYRSSVYLYVYVNYENGRPHVLGIEVRNN